MATATRESVRAAPYVQERYLPATETRALGTDLGGLLTRGAFAGFAAGVAFLLANMGFATTQGKPAVAPLMDISTIFHGTSAPAAMKPTEDMIATGLVTHTGLSMLFGIGFAFLVAPLAWRARATVGQAAALIVGGVVYGLVLYVVNFQVLGNTLFEWFTNPKGPNQPFEIGAHAGFGLLLAPFFFGMTRRVRRDR